MDLTIVSPFITTQNNIFPTLSPQNQTDNAVGCDNLTSVEVKRAEPLPINRNTFSNYADATLYVPKGSLSAYMAADNWNLFGKIVELSGIKGDVNNDGEVTVADVSMLVDAILNFSKGIPFTPADINGDGMFSVVDVMGIVNHILNE